MLVSTANRVVSSIFHAIAITSTALRLGYRMHTRRLWWDDFWAFLAALCTIPLWILYQTGRYLPIINQRHVVAWRIAHALLFTLVLWCARQSVAVTLVRILPEGNFRRCAKIVAGVFSLFCIALIIEKFTRCGVMSLAKLANCTNPKWTGTMELSTDVVADTWLIFAPAYMLYNTNLRANHRRLIIAIFSCAFLTTIASIVHCTYIFIGNIPASAISGNVQAAISVVVCNLLVLVTFIYRAYQRGRNIMTDAAEAETDEVRGIRSMETRSNRLWSLSNITFTEISTEVSSSYAGQPSLFSSDGTGVIDKMPPAYTLPMRISAYPQTTNTRRTM